MICSRLLTLVRGVVLSLAVTAVFDSSLCLGQDRISIPEIPRLIPPLGDEITYAERQELLTSVVGLYRQLSSYSRDSLIADIEVLVKAVELAVDLGEFYSPDDVDKARELLDLAQSRIDSLSRLATPWTMQSGRVVRGYYSRIDGSPQPYGLELPRGWDSSKPMPLYVWLHGRGDRTTDLHFIHQRMHYRGKIEVDDAIIVHPFGRHCVGFKSVGEIDVLEVVEEVQRHYPIDPDRIVLMGFSMGGAGVWHLGAHYADRWVAMSPGAGFAETREYNRLKPSDYPPSYEQTLWRQYDVPNYARNLLNLPVIAYSGENDKQIQAALVMEQALAEHGLKLNHVIGPGMGHDYHPESLKSILAQLAEATQQGLNRNPDKVFIQTPTLRYSRMFGYQITGLSEHWLDSRVDFERDDDQLEIRTQNVTGLRIDDPRSISRIQIDEQELAVEQELRPILLSRDANAHWSMLPPLGSRPSSSQPLRSLPLSSRPAVSLRPSKILPTESQLRKRPGLQGPIDDAWLEPFVVVKPSKPSPHPQVQAWLDFELKHFELRWQALFRGHLPVKLDTQLTPEDIATKNLILWGDPASNRVLAEMIHELPLTWNEDQVQIGEHQYPAATHIPAMIYPNPENPSRYVVLNSGPTFREGHDRTNSLQNPKLPDWAILDLSQPPNELSAGKVMAADFFDEEWQLK